MSASGIEKRFPLNTAQLRNLRNWAEAERPIRTVAVVSSPPRPTPPADARKAVLALVGRHEALRSRLARDPGGELVQEVLVADHVDVAWTEAELPAGGAPRTPERVPPDERACRVALYLRDGLVEVVVLSVSHVFADAFGARALTRDLGRLLAGEDVPEPRQASRYAVGPADPRVQENTAHWRELLADAPRSCTYSGVERDEFEKVETAHVPLTPEQDARIISACRELRVTPYALWVGAISVLVSGVCGQHRQVFRSTYANRFAPADFDAVAQLAQAVYLPIEGSADDTLRTRVDRSSRSSLATLDRGGYDANALLDELNGSPAGENAVFQPAFELNYVRAPSGAAAGESRERRRVEVADVRIDPPSAKADLAVTVSHVPGSVVRLAARRPVGGQRGAMDLATDCLAVLDLLCADPDTSVGAVPVDAFPAIAGLLPGHHSGVAVDPELTRRLVTSHPAVVSCELDLRRDGGAGTLHARVATDRPVTVPELRRELCERQPWFSGSVVPDAITTR